jgi:hypothetical protein
VFVNNLCKYGFGYILENIVQILLAITVGVFILRYAKKLPESKLFSIKFKGYAAGVGFILLGIIHLLNEFHLW